MIRFLHISLLLVALACGSQKEVVTTTLEPPKPSWINGKPIENSYYAGIGVASKSAGQDYKSIAKNNALNDLASEISVNVSSSSLFYQVEQDERLREEFQANTRLKSKENLAGYELVGTWESNDQYWVYYRLNKYDYEQLKKERLAKDVALSKQLFAKAENFKANNQYAESLTFTMKAISAVKDHMGEPIQTEWNGNTVFLLVELYAALQETLSSINLQPIYPDIQVKRGEAVSAELLSFIATAPNGQPLANLPIYLYYSGQRIKNNQVYTNASGMINYTLSRVTSIHSKEYFQVNVNVVALATEATEDPFVRKLMGKVSGPEAKVEINIEKPTIYIESNELNLNEKMNAQTLASSFRQNFINDGFEITDSPETANYILSVNAVTRATARQGRFYTASLDATIQFKRTDGELLYERPITGFMGMQLDQEKAGEDAYRKLASEIDKRYFREMRRKVFD